MSDQTHSVARKPRFSLDSWAVLAATVFVVLIVVGVLPRVPW
jgi:hypothetical protein